MTAADAPAEWQQVEIAKVRLLAMCEAAGMGREVNRRVKVRPAIHALEALNPVPRPLESPELLSAGGSSSRPRTRSWACHAPGRSGRGLAAFCRASDRT